MRLHSQIAAVIVFVGLYAFGASASATLKVYYDPLTGNVSLDTAETRTGGIHTYGFGLNPHQTDIRFNSENQVRLSNSTLYTTESLVLSDASLSTDIRGLVTIGNVLPTGIGSETWQDLFSVKRTTFSLGDIALGGVTYVDAIGTGTPALAPEFIYGHPGREFDNRWDLFDPDMVQWASAAKLVYRPWSGEVVLDTTGPSGGYIASFLLRSSAGLFDPEEYTTPTDGLSLPNASSIGLIADAIYPGRYSLGDILPTNLSEPELLSTFTEAIFIARAGFKRGSFDFESDGLPFHFVVASIPEPTSAALLTIVVLGAATASLKPGKH